MSNFNSPAAMTSQTVYAGWRFDRPPGYKITADCETPQAAGLAIQAYGRQEGLAAENVEFYIVQETTTYTPLTKTVFTVVVTTTPAT